MPAGGLKHYRAGGSESGVLSPHGANHAESVLTRNAGAGSSPRASIAYLGFSSSRKTRGIFAASAGARVSVC